MLRGLYTATSGMLCQEAATQTLANNLANVNTAGFKKDNVIYRDFPSMLLRRINDPTKKIYENRVDPWPYVGKLGTGTIVDEIYNDRTQGDFHESGNTTDLALNGKGFFVVDTPNGVAYTRNGTFKIGAGGRICTLEGFPLLARKSPTNMSDQDAVINEKGEYPIDVSEIKVEENTKQFTVGEDGKVFIDGEERFRLLVVDFENTNRVLKRGKDLFFATEGSGMGLFQGQTRVYQGKLENSNVSAVESMVRLITAQRSYEANQKVIQNEDQSLNKLINEVGRA
ncbi:MAG: flagellar hook-basal body protein [Candidatus Wallbacteria bacterium]|nr:flagellar hook-basal body protein [Candidatus Wallbacteria bacterium]